MQAEQAVMHRIGVAEEPVHGLVERFCDQEQCSSRNPVVTAFIFVDLLARTAKLLAQLRLRHSSIDPRGPNSLANLRINIWGHVYRSQCFSESR